MAIRLAQVGRTTTSITFSVSGITGDRQTLIWIPFISTPAWYTLSGAKTLGYISNYSTTSDTNGNITVNFYSSNTQNYPVWKFKVSDDNTIWSGILFTIIKFEWDGVTTKVTGDDYDITHNDAVRFSLFASHIKSWLMNTSDSPTSITNGEVIVSEWLESVDKINDAAEAWYGNGGTLQIITYCAAIGNNMQSGYLPYASVYNGMSYIINNFNPKV